MSLKFVQRTNSRPEAPTGSLTYEPHFGLIEKAFSLTTDQRFVYYSPAHLAAALGLVAGIRRREGLLVLTGEIGTGKTTLCRTVLRDLGRNTYSSLVPDPFASREDLLKMLLVDFEVLSVQELTSSRWRQASRTELGYQLSEFLGSLAPEAFAIVVIDEAQNLSLPLIEEVRLLSDTYGAKGRLQIILVGQPELHAKLKLPEMRQVDQRVCGYHRLAPMSRDAVGGYIQHRLRIAGGGPERVLFPPEIVDALHSRSGGVPRLINRVCDHALQLAYERCAEVVSREILDAALLEIGAATLSPTWDSIVHAQPASEARPAAPEARPAASEARPAAPEARPSAPEARPAAPEARPAAPETGPVVNAVDLTPTIDDREDFHRQVDQWVAQDLASPAPAAPPPSTPVQRPPSATRAYRNEWPSDVRSETYMQRFWRMWLRRVAIAGALYLAAHVAIAGLSFTADIFSRPAPEAAPLPPPVQPAPVPVQPAPVAPGRSPADAPNPDPVVASTAAPPAVAVTSGDYFVAVGLFADGARADRLVDTLIKAGLPAMQRPSELRGQPVQRVVLGPFVSRTDAIAGLRRLQALGGHDDARVIGQ